MWEMWYRNARVLLSTHTHARRTHTDAIFVFANEVIFLEFSPHHTRALLPPPPAEPYKSNLVSCVACQVWGKVAAREMEKQTQFPSLLGTQPGQMESAAACYLLRAPNHATIPRPFSLPQQEQETRASSQ